MGDPEVSVYGLTPSPGAVSRALVFLHPLLWVGVAFVLRAAFALYLGDRLYQADEYGYTEAARALAASGSYAINGEALIGAPGASLFFSIFLFFTNGLLGPRFAQAGLSAATAWMLGRLTRAATGSERAGLLALAAAALYPFFVYYSGILMSETLYLAALVAGLWALVLSLDEQGRHAPRAAAAGAAFAAAGLTRTECVPIAFVLGAALAWLCFRRRYAWRSWVLAALCWAAPLAGWAARNKSHCGRLTLDLHGGMTLLHGTMFYDIDQMDTAFSQQAFELTPLYREGQALPEAERDRLYFNAGLRYMRDNPGTTLRHWAQKAVAFWRLYPRLDKDYPDTPTASPGAGASRRLLVVASLLSEPALILLGFWGAWLLRDRLAALFPLYWLVLATFGVHVVVVSQMRYRLPVMPILMLFAAAAVEKLWPADVAAARGDEPVNLT